MEEIIDEASIAKALEERKALKKKVVNDISVVIQGKVFGEPGDGFENQLTMQCISSIRNLLPNAEIVLSTWKGTVVSHLDYDKLVLNDDPGAISYSEKEPTYFNNNRRQTVSTLAGLNAATKTYAVKMRGDCKLSDVDFIYHLKDYPRGNRYRFFKQRVVIPTKYSRNPRRIAQLIHPSDIFQAGLLDDLLNLWDLPLQPEPETTRAIPEHKKVFNNALNGGYYRMKFGAEQYNWYAFCKKNGLDLELKHYSHIPANKILASDMSIINNFVIDDAIMLGVNLPKKMYVVHDKDLYTHAEWYYLSKKYLNETSKFYEFSLIFQVYLSNFKRIFWRMQHRLVKFGFKDFSKVLVTYLSRKTHTQPPVSSRTQAASPLS